MKTIKLPGFTLVELIIVLLLSTLVTFTCLSLLAFANESSNTFSEINDTYLEVATFAEAFERELFLCTEVLVLSAHEFLLRAPDFEIAYVFTERGIEKKFTSPLVSTFNFALPASILRIEKGYNSRLKQATAIIEMEFKEEEGLKLFFEKR